MAEAMAEGDGKKRAGLTGAVLAAVKAAVKFVPRAPAVGTEEVADPEERPGVLYHRADAEIDHFRRHRLGQKLGHARVPRRADMLGFRIGGTDDDRHVGIGAFLVLADPGQEGHAVQAMGPVAQDKINLELDEYVPGHFRVWGAVDGGYAELAEHVGQQPAYQKVLFKHKYAQLSQVIGTLGTPHPIVTLALAANFNSTPQCSM